MNIAIIEDDLQCYKDLHHDLTQFQNEIQLEINVKHYTNVIEFINYYSTQLDLILLDIEMPHLNGIDFAKKIREVDQEVIIIFVTQTAQYAIEGYQVNAYDYILKPVNYYALSMKLKQVLKIINNHKDDFIVISTQKEKRKINLSHLKYIESKNHTLLFYTTEHCYQSSVHSLKKLADSLYKNHFIRCHNSYLINLHYVSGYTTNTVMINNEQIPMSRTYYKQFMNELLEYWGD